MSRSKEANIQFLKKRLSTNKLKVFTNSLQLRDIDEALLDYDKYKEVIELEVKRNMNAGDCTFTIPTERVPYKPKIKFRTYIDMSSQDDDF